MRAASAPAALRFARPAAPRQRLPAIDVAVAIVRAGDGRVLLAERTARQIAAGFWELPGGKIDPGETPAQAAARELAEEIGITALSQRAGIVYEHAFKTKRVRLHFFRVERWSGTPHGCEGQRLAWVDPGAPAVTPILPSNDRVLAALGLGRRGAFVNGAAQPELEALLTAGVRLIFLCEPHRGIDQGVAAARRINAQARAFGAHVLLEGSALEARRAGVCGVHSSAAHLRRQTVRPNVRIWSAACQDAADLARAVALGADVVVVSPALRALAAEGPVPTYVRDGLVSASLEPASAGAGGVALRGDAFSH